MKRLLVLGLLAAIVASIAPAAATSFAVGCFITGGGRVPTAYPGSGLDTLSGEASSRRDHSAEGTWTHITADGHEFRGAVDILSCRAGGGGDPGHPKVDFTLGNMTGTGTWDGTSGHTFEVEIVDRGEQGYGDRYGIRIDDPDGNLLYRTVGYLTSGDIQVHPVNPGHP
jgi:hypothetical protein